MGTEERMGLAEREREGAKARSCNDRPLITLLHK